MPNHDPQSSAWIWTEYWRTGRRGCLTDEAPLSAQDSIAMLWRHWFEQLPPGASIIDLACGSGEVADIARLLSEEKHRRLVIEGVDLARLEGKGDWERARNGTTMRLRGGIDIVRLPFPACSFDAAVSQFGIEYAQPERACREVARVLKPEASGLFVVHHAQSAITAAAKSRLEAFVAAFGNGVAFDRARDVYASISERAPRSVVGARLSKFRESLRAARAVRSDDRRWEGNLEEILGFLSDLARDPQAYDPFDALRRLNIARDSVAAWKMRQQSQLAAARDDAGINVFAYELRAAGLETRDIGVVHDPADDAIIAWRLSVVRGPQRAEI